jgi:signal transduction histidine kinase
MAREQKRIRITNQLAIAFAVAMAVWAALVLAIERRWVIVGWDVAIALGMALVPWMNRRGWTVLARNWCVTLVNGTVFLFPACFGEATGTHYLFLPATAVPFALFETKSSRSIAYGVLLPMILFFILVGSDFTLIRVYEEAPPAWVFWLTIASAFLLSFLPIYAFSRANERAEAELEVRLTEAIARERVIDEQRAKMITAAKLSALGEMAAGIAHEVNNPLMALVLRIGLLRRALASGTPREECEGLLDDMNRTIERTGAIIQGLRSFSHDDDRAPLVDVPVRRIVDETLSFCRERFRSRGIDLVVPDIPEALTVRCRPIQVSQVLLNLLNNAFDAVVGQPEKRIEIAVSAEERGGARISVMDSGPGISDAVAGKIFQPFFTTKPVGQGTGLGLSISKGIIQAHGGDLSFERRAKGGMRFWFRLPGSAGAPT